MRYALMLFAGMALVQNGCIDPPPAACFDYDDCAEGSTCRNARCQDAPDATLDAEPCDSHPEEASGCDGLDNDCDGRTDEHIDFTRDADHCGGCGVTCDADDGPACVEGACARPCAVDLSCYAHETCVGEQHCEARLRADNPGAQDRFGQTLALDGSTLVVGAVYEDGLSADEDGDALEQSGAVYVFDEVTLGHWSQIDYLKASNPDVADAFGSAVAVSGDRIAVGAPFEDGSRDSTGEAPNDAVEDAGAVYVFERQRDGRWRQSAYIKAFNAGPIDHFGYSVALDGDRLVVGARGEDGDATSTRAEPNRGAENAGAVYTYRLDGQTWQPEAYLKATHDSDRPAQAGDRFGASVALDGDVLVVGADRASLDEPDSDGEGAVYVFEMQDGGWSQTALLRADAPDGGDDFGGAVSVSGHRIAIGARVEQGEDNASQGSGAVYVFSRQPGGTWTRPAYLKASNSGLGHHFGDSVDLRGTRLLIGAGRENGDAASTAADPNLNARYAGAAYLFDLGADGEWTQRRYIKASDAMSCENFGIAVVLGERALAIGARTEHNIGCSRGYPRDDTGSVYIVRQSD